MKKLTIYKSLLFHGGDTGSIPVRDAKAINHLQRVHFRRGRGELIEAALHFSSYPSFNGVIEVLESRYGKRCRDWVPGKLFYGYFRISNAKQIE